jgi:hypothetical protein
MTPSASKEAAVNRRLDQRPAEPHRRRGWPGRHRGTQSGQNPETSKDGVRGPGQRDPATDPEGPWAKGQGAVRSQMEVRISFRVRESAGTLAAGWHAHTLNAPGKFLIAAAEHDTAKRARAYLLTDQTVEAAATSYADLRPPLDAVSRQAIEDQDPHPERAVVPPDPDTTTSDSGGDGPDTLLWVALMLAPPDGTTVPDLMAETGISRPWIYLRLRDLRLHRRPRRMTSEQRAELIRGHADTGKDAAQGALEQILAAVDGHGH